MTALVFRGEWTYEDLAPISFVPLYAEINVDTASLKGGLDGEALTLADDGKVTGWANGKVFWPYKPEFDRLKLELALRSIDAKDPEVAKVLKPVLTELNAINPDYIAVPIPAPVVDAGMPAKTAQETAPVSPLAAEVASLATPVPEEVKAPVEAPVEAPVAPAEVAPAA